MVEEILKKSISQGFTGFQLYFQPQFWTHTEELYGAEALARFWCKEYGNIPPDVFIPFLERERLIIPFGRWVFKKAAEQGKKWSKVHPGFQISINMSGYQFADKDFTKFTEDLLKEIGLPAKNITIEITETYDINASDTAHEVLSRMQTAGFRIAMDDFGTGSSNLLALRAHPFKTVKIARQLMTEDIGKKDDPFLSAVSLLCHSMGADVCQEGIETAAQLNAMKSARIELVQGFLMGKPMPAEEFERTFFEKID